MSSEVHHLHPAAMLIAAIKTIRRWIGAAAIPGVAALAGGGWQMTTLILVGVLVIVVGSALWGFLSWRATTYEVSGGAFHLRQGVIQKNERTIPLEHVQSVDTVQGIIQRFFGVVEVRVETAGGGTSEPDASLSALNRGAAEALRREIAGFRREDAVDEEQAGPAVLRRLGTRELLLAGATSGQIGVALSLIAVVSQLFDNVLSEGFAQRLFESLAPRSVTAVLVYVFLLGLFAWLLAIGGTVLAHAGFTLSRDGDFLYIRRGLLERREATIPLARIQAVRVSEGLLRQPFGLASLRVESAGYGEDAGVSTFLFPLLPRREVEELLAGAAPEFAGAPVIEPLPRRSLRRYVFRATFLYLIFAFAAALVSYLVFQSALGLFGLFLIPPAAAYGWLCYRDAGWAFQEDRLIVRHRSLGRKTAIAPRLHLQSRGMVSSPFQRRVRLATFLAEVASGSGGSVLRVKDLDGGASKALVYDLGQ